MDVLQEEVNTSTICSSVKEGIKDLGSDEDHGKLIAHIQGIVKSMNQVSTTFKVFSCVCFTNLTHTHNG